MKNINFYEALWSEEGRQIMSKVLQNPEFIKPNFTFWQEHFKVDPQITPSNGKGVASFTSVMREMEVGGLMDMRAPLGETLPVDKKGAVAYSGSIPDFSAKGFVETAAERLYDEEIASQFNGSERLAVYAVNHANRMMNEMNMTLSNLSAQLMSEGKIIYKGGEGIHAGVIKAEIPAENFTTAGEGLWNNPATRILSQMRGIEEKYRNLWGLDFAMQWNIPAKMFRDCFLKNEEVIEWVRYTNVINNTPLPESLILTEDMVKTAIAKFPELSPIVIVEEKQNDYTRGVVHGWADGIAVLRPAGYAGFIRRSTVLDEKVFKKYGNSVNSYYFTPAPNGLGVFMNSVTVNGNFKEWHSDLFMKAIPTLDEFLYHVIVDTTTVDE